MFMFFNAPYEEYEEELRVKRRRLRDANTPIDLPEEEFMKEYRVSKKVFMTIFNEVTPKIKRKHRTTAIPEITRLACFLSALAGNYQSRVGNNSNTAVSQAMASKIVGDYLEIFEDHFCDKWINLEMTEQEENKVKLKFYNETEVPSIIGCVDCTHIAIQCPRLDTSHVYRNDTGGFSINALIICDVDLMVRYIDARNPGENDDDFVWQKSDPNLYFKSKYDAGKRNFWLIGDTDFKLQPYLMTPYREPVESYEVNYNEKCLKAQSIMEKCLNAIESRFPVLTHPKGMHYLPEKATKIINVCCAIHNACVFYKDDLPKSDKTFLNVDKQKQRDIDDSESYDSDVSEFNNEMGVPNELLRIREKLAKSLRDEKCV
uniref:Putative nuclease HARBI1 n=1 Tax=Ceratitis capitata TaxID=7213 RepID=W8C221_CERCA